MIAEWFNNLFKKKYIYTINHQFGRQINALVDEKELEYFNQALTYFEEKKVIDAYESYLQSLINYSNRSSNNNIIINREDDKLTFELYQGIAKIYGEISEKRFFAYSKLTHYNKINVAIKRRFLERNYQLTYARVYEEDGITMIKIQLDNSTMTPQKIFYPLRELALNSDYEKEFLSSDFPDVELLDIDHKKEISDDEKRIKFSFLKSWIEHTKESLTSLPSNDNIGIHSYIYLTLLMKIDYLIVPHKHIGYNISKKVLEYFTNSEKLLDTKNAELDKYINSLYQLKYHDFAHQLYNTTSTFSPMDLVPKDELNTFIDESLAKVSWYKNNRYYNAIPIIYDFIALYILYNYGLRSSLLQVMQIVVEVQMSEYFTALGYTPLHDKKSDKFEKKLIIQRIEDAIETDIANFKELDFDTDELSFESLNEFSHTFYQQIKYMSYE